MQLIERHTDARGPYRLCKQLISKIVAIYHRHLEIIALGHFALAFNPFFLRPFVPVAIYIFFNGASMSDQDDPLLLGLPRNIRFNYAACISYIDKHPELLVSIGDEHAKHGNQDSAAMCWREAMLQTTDPFVRCDAAIRTVEGYKNNQEGHTPNMHLATKILLARAEKGNEKALRALSQYYTFPSNQP